MALSVNSNTGQENEVEIENRDQAVALAGFLWREKQRHLDDIEQIDRDLDVLKRKWKVTPVVRRVYVRP